MAIDPIFTPTDPTALPARALTAADAVALALIGPDWVDQAVAAGRTENASDSRHVLFARQVNALRDAVDALLAGVVHGTAASDARLAAAYAAWSAAQLAGDPTEPSDWVASLSATGADVQSISATHNAATVDIAIERGSGARLNAATATKAGAMTAAHAGQLAAVSPLGTAYAAWAAARAPGDDTSPDAWLGSRTTPAAPDPSSMTFTR